MSTTDNNTNLIPTFGNARGILYYTIGTNGRIYTKDGWFHRHHMNNDVIIGRNFRGRRAMTLTTIHNVVDFVPTAKAVN
jgi:hypothetical protein